MPNYHVVKHVRSHGWEIDIYRVFRTEFGEHRIQVRGYSMNHDGTYRVYYRGPVPEDSI